MVHKDLQIAFKERPSAKRYPAALNQRNELIGQGVLVQEDDHYAFSEEVEFSSPSAAAAVVAGGSMNGLLAWKNGKGQTLKELEAGNA